MTPLQNTYPPSRIQKPNLFPRPRQYFTNNEALFTNTDLKFEGDYTPRRYDVLSTLEEELRAMSTAYVMAPKE
ncbi:unnamed protein product [Rhizophagus irregularis]|nr:unnamed protein product [Rhizophagus irregularis]